MAFTKITNQELNSRGATTLPNQPKISATALKQEFDAPAKNIVAPKFNNLIDELEATTAAASLGAVAPTGRTGETVQAVIDDISDDLATLEAGVGPAIAEAHTHPNKELLDTYTQTEEALASAVADDHTHSNKALLDTYTQTEANLADAVTKKHTHSNKSILDKFYEAAGKLKYDVATIVTNAFKTIKVGNTTFNASDEDTIEFIAGSNVTLSPSTVGGKSITISASGGGSGTGDMQKTVYDSDNAVADALGIKAFVAANAMKLDGSNAGSHVTFDGAFTVGERATGTVGTNSVTEGYDNKATAAYSHAEGNATTASGAKSHAEGYNTTASGIESHAEGNGTTASGNDSHAEGINTTASGVGSHAGGSGTTAGYAYQTVIGEYNDNKSGTLFEVGNGTASTASNAFEVFSNGDVNFAGTLKNGGTDYASDKYTTGDSAETTIDDADYFPFYDTSATAKKKSLWSNIKSVLKTYLDTVHMKIDGSNYAALVTFDELQLLGGLSIGETTDNTGSQILAVGRYHAVTGNGSAAVGQYNSISGNYSLGVGTRLTSAYTKQLVVGYYNDNKSNTIFEVGNGTGSNDKKNVFEVYNNGDINFTGKMLNYLENDSVVLSTSQTTTVTFTNAKITTSSMIDFYCTQWNLVPEDITVASGSCTITLPQVDTAATVGVRIYVR